MSAPLILLLTDFDSWHEAELIRALCHRKARVVTASLQDCALSGGPANCFGLDLPGCDTRLPDAAFVRFVPGGSFEQVTLHLDVLHALAECGVVVYNTAHTIERTVDKAMTSFLLAKAAVAAAPAYACKTPAQARAVIDAARAEGKQMVLKPLFGSRGKGLTLIDRGGSQLPDAETCNGVYYLQEFVGSSAGEDATMARDWRVMVIDGKAVAAMERRATDWITNRAQGGQCYATTLSAPLRALAEHASAVVNAGYAGVDVIADRLGKLQVLEINGIPAWQGLQSVSDIDIAQRLADDLLARLTSRHRRHRA